LVGTESAIIGAKKIRISGGIMIPIEVKEEIRRLIEGFNLRVNGFSFVFHFQEGFLYLFRSTQGRINLYARLTYLGNIKKWDCAYFNKETNRYENIVISDSENSLIFMLNSGIPDLNKYYNKNGGYNE